MRGDEWGSVLKTVGRSYVTSPHAKMLPAAVAPYVGVGSAGSARRERVPGSDTRWVRFPRRSGVRACPRKALSLGRCAGGLRRRGWRAPRNTVRARGRAWRPSRRDVAAQRQLIQLALFEKEKLQKCD
jgi:hypothetical protein